MAKLNAHTFSSRGAAQDHYLALIDAAANKARYIDPAQEVIYRKKIEEARYNGGPLLQAEAAATGVDISCVCAAVLREAACWDQHINAIEIERVAAKAEVRTATLAADMHVIYTSFEQTCQSTK